MEEILAHSYYRYSVYHSGLVCMLLQPTVNTVFRHRLFGFFFEAVPRSSSLPSAVCSLLTR